MFHITMGHSGVPRVGVRTNSARQARNLSQRGGALLAVLWLSAALAAIGVAVATTVRSETDRVSTSSDGLRAWYLASGSVERGIQWMLWGPSVTNPDGTPR